MTHRIRPYAVTDKPACMAVFDSNVPDYFDLSERDMLSTWLDAPKGEYYVVEQDGKVIGCGGFAREVRGQARFTWGMVHNNHHGEGLGRLLAEHRLAEIEKTGAYSEAELFTTPQVAPFFRKFGFVDAGTKKDGFAPGMDQVQMIKRMGETADG